MKNPGKPGWLLISALVIGSALFMFSFFPSWAFQGPGSGPGVGSGAVGVDSSNNLSVGTSTTKAETKFLIIASSTDTTNFALKILQPSQMAIFTARNDGTISVSGTLNATNIYGQF